MPVVTEVVSARVDKAVKRRAERVISSSGLTFSEVISNTLSSIACSGQIPPSAMPRRRERASSVERIRDIRSQVPPEDLMSPMSREDVKSELGGRDA